MGKQGRAIEATTHLLETWMGDNNQCQVANLFEELEDLGVPQTEAISILHKAFNVAMDEQRRRSPVAGF